MFGGGEFNVGNVSVSPDIFINFFFGRLTEESFRLLTLALC